MKPITKIYIGLAVTAIFAIGILGGNFWSNHKITKLERSVEMAKQKAESAGKLAQTREAEAAGYKQKIEYLESHLTEIQTIARKQDEQLEKLTSDTSRARRDVADARRTRTIAATAATAAELCQKLAELGHGCE